MNEFACDRMRRGSGNVVPWLGAMGCSVSCDRIRRGSGHVVPRLAFELDNMPHLSSAPIPQDEYYGEFLSFVVL